MLSHHKYWYHDMQIHVTGQSLSSIADDVCVSEKSQQLLDEWSWNLLQMFMVSCRWTLHGAPSSRFVSKHRAAGHDSIICSVLSFSTQTDLKEAEKHSTCCSSRPLRQETRDRELWSHAEKHDTNTTSSLTSLLQPPCDLCVWLYECISDKNVYFNVKLEALKLGEAAPHAR